MLPLITIYLAAVALAHNAESARILGLFPHTGKSHQMVFNPLLRKLAERGHQVTVVSHFPVNNPPSNYTDVSLEGIAGLGLESIDMAFFENPNTFLKTLGVDKIVKQFSEFQPLADMALEICSKLVNFAPLADVLKKEYDVVLVEQFNSDCMVGLAHVYGVKAPMISMLSSNLMHWSPSRVGVSYNPSHVPIVSADYSERMTFRQRLENTLLNMFYNLWYRYAIQLKEEAIIEKHFAMQIPDLQDLGKNTTMMLVNAFHSLNGARPLLPGIVEVGGMHLDHTRKAIPSVS